MVLIAATGVYLFTEMKAFLEEKQTWKPTSGFFNWKKQLDLRARAIKLIITEISHEIKHEGSQQNKNSWPRYYRKRENESSRKTKKCTKFNPSISTKFTALHWFDKSIEHSRNPLNNDKAFTIRINAKAKKQIILTHPFSQLILTKIQCFLRRKTEISIQRKYTKNFGT